MISSHPPALVQPRATSPISQQPFPLVDLILDQQDSEVRKIRIVGRGLRTALAYLKHELQDHANIQILSEDETVESIEPDNLVVFATQGKAKGRTDLVFKLLRWGQDEVIEYLIAKAPERCKSVMSRLTAADDIWLGNGSPRVLSTVLDQMIESDEIQSVEQGIRAHFDQLAMTSKQRGKLSSVCIEHLFSPNAAIALHNLSPRLIDADTVKFFSNDTVRYVLGADRVIQDLRKEKKPKPMKVIWSETFTELMAEKIKNDLPVNDYLNSLTHDKTARYASNAASLLVASDKTWRPSGKEGQCFESAKLSRVNWSEASLKASSLARADFSDSVLRKVQLQNALLVNADFFRSDLSGANLSHCLAPDAEFIDAIMRAISAEKASFNSCELQGAVLECSNLSDANFSDANLSFANLSNCNLSKANFLKAKLDHVNFSNSKLSEAKLRWVDLRTVNLDSVELSGASLNRCNLEGQSLERVGMKSASFARAILTGTRFRNCNMQNCRLTTARMANIDWEDCDLRRADFSYCQFLMGSTRAGTVDSPYPSHGTRTGYYTDDHDDHYFKTPEETRKANLCGCNLLGAEIYKADFYLVDLRGAKYDDDQREHFEKCKAILD